MDNEKRLILGLGRKLPITWQKTEVLHARTTTAKTAYSIITPKK
ncbi:hypothetical protein [Aeromonas veronii]|nr:hypothetical protein [Aeromonas veronii]